MREKGERGERRMRGIGEREQGMGNREGGRRVERRVSVKGEGEERERREGEIGETIRERVGRERRVGERG